MAASARRILLLSLAACAISHAAAARALDQTRIHAYYHDGEFDKVIRELEAFQKSGRACSHAESLFVEKHLAVVYAANPGTRELGRYHMFRILDLAPTSDLLDMFVGEEVGGVFEKVGKEYALRDAAKPAMAKTNPPTPAAPVSARPAATKASASRPYPSAAPARPAPAAAGLSASSPTGNARPASSTYSSSSSASAPANQKPPAKAAAGSTYASAGIAPPRPSTGSLPDSSSSAKAAGASSPAWKEPGLWIGGGAALAVVAFTLFYSGSESSAPESKTYVVPATASR